MLFLNIFNIIFTCISIIFIILSVYPLSIYELVVRSVVMNMDNKIKKKYNLPIVKKFTVFSSNDNIHSSDGIMDIVGDNVIFTINGTRIELDIVKEYDKIVPMIYSK